MRNVVTLVWGSLRLAPIRGEREEGRERGGRKREEEEGRERGRKKREGEEGRKRGGRKREGEEGRKRGGRKRRGRGAREKYMYQCSNVTYSSCNVMIT